MSEGSQLQTNADDSSLTRRVTKSKHKRTMKHFIYITCVAAFSLSSLAQAAPPEARLPEKHQAFFKAHCLDCHDSETREGKVDLETLSFRITTLEQAELWQKVLNAMNAGEMPPEDSEQPSNTEKADFLDDLAQTMVTARQALSDSGGRITMRRLNRREYQNTIEQLTGVKVDVDSLPTDGGSGTFDTVGASQFISSDQFEQYLKLGRQAIDEAFERQAARKQPSQVFRVEPETTVNVQSRKNVETMEETYKRYLLWKAEVDKAAQAPENQKVIEQIREKYKLDDLTDNIRLYQNADLLKSGPDATKFGFRDANAASFSYQGGYGRTYAYMKHYLELPNSDRGTYLKLAWAIQRIDVTPKPEDVPPGTYKLRVRAGAVKGSDPSRHFIEIGHPQHVNQVPAGFASKPLASLQVTGTEGNPEIIETTLVIGSNTPREFGIQERQPEANKKALSREFYAYKRENGYGTPPAIWVDWVELEGPISSETWKQRREVEEHANVKVGGTYNGYFKGGHEQAKAFLETGKPQKGIPDEQEAKFRIRSFEEHGPTYRRYLDDPLTRTGSFLTISNVNKEEFIALPPEHPSGWRKTKHVVESLPPGDYKLRFRIGAIEGTPSERHFVDLRAVPDVDQFQHLATFQITGSTAKPQTIEVPIQLSNNGPRKFALREKRDPKTDTARYNAAREETGLGPVPALWIDWVEWEGPFDSPTTQSPLQAILAKHAGNPKRERGTASDTSKSASLANGAGYQEDACAILTEFSESAFRDVSPESDFIDRLVAIYETRRNVGDSLDEAIRTPLSVILASPGFLYLFEPGDEAERRQLNDRELAVRLSYFLWSGPPDAELLQLAEQNKLHLPETLRQQVDRLIADPRADEFVAGFVHQWLDMERLDFFQFDVNLHRDFDESTRAATREEVYQSFAHLLRANGNPKRERGTESTEIPRSRVGLPGHTTRNDGRLGKLLKSDYVFVNGLLATYYGIEGVTGDEFRKIKLPADSPRGGLLGMAAIHAMGSDGVVSSPVERGAWVLRHLLNDPPPPAPPNVPQISRLEGQNLTTRERLLAHQEEAQCASCHRKIDPIGFGLENFNAAGKWRTEGSYQARDSRGGGVGKRKTRTIDASGAFHNGPKFGDYHELRDLIADREEDFARGFTEHLIEYALGRPFGFTDEDRANEVVSSAKSNEFAVSEFIHALVQSKSFRTK